MLTSNESNQNETTAELQQMGLQRNVCGNFLTVKCNRSTISNLLQKSIKVRKTVMDGFSYLPAAAVSSCTRPDPGKDDHTSDPAKARIAETRSLMSHPSTAASPEADRLLEQFHHAKRARVEDIIQGMSGLPKARRPREGRMGDGDTRGGRTFFQAGKQKKSLPRNLSQRLGGGTCSGKGEELREMKGKLWAMQRFLEELQQQQGFLLGGASELQQKQGFLQGEQPSSSQAWEAEKVEGGLPEYDHSKRDLELQEGSDCKPQTHHDKEQIPQEGDSYLMLNKGHKNLLETLKRELSQAVNKSVDFVFENLSPTLFHQSHQAYVKQVPFSNYTKPRNETLIPSPQEPSLDKEVRWPVVFQKSEVSSTEGQTEALSFGIRDPSSIRCPSLNQVGRRPSQSLQAPLWLNRQHFQQEKQILEHRTYAPLSKSASLPCKNQAVGQVSQEAWGRTKVKPEVNATSMGRQTHPGARGQEVVGSLRHPYAFVSRDIQAVVERNVLMAVNEGLTHNHLKKAKLMFFYCRYPNSNVLKTFFPDIKFNRCITSQLIKWFSNFREFYYIQVEKCSRQFMADGVSRASDLSVTRDADLFRSLNVHFNKANDFQVPSRFLEVAEITLREFFNAISLAKDLDPSWKKAIYKVIGKLDSDVPEAFKTTISW